MQTEIKTDHGLATITAPYELTPEQQAATHEAATAIDDFCWRCGAGSSTLTAGDAEISWQLTAEPTAVLDGRLFDLRDLDTAIGQACNIDCQLYRAGRCHYHGTKHQCPRVLNMLDDAEASDE